MKKLFEMANSKMFAISIAIIVIAKLIWFMVTQFWLQKDVAQSVAPSMATVLSYIIKFQSSQTPQNISSIKLLGLYSSDTTIVATIQNSGQTVVLSKGEELNGYRLDSGGSDWIKLTKGDEEMLLKLENTKIESLQSNTASQATNTTSSPQVVPSTPTMNVSPQQTMSHTMQDEEEDGMKEYRNSKNELSGIVVTDVYSGSLQQKIGLQKDDSIKEINGKPISKMFDINDVYNQLSSNKSIKIKITRDGEEKELSYEVR